MHIYKRAVVIDVSSTDHTLNEPCQAIYVGDGTATHDLVVNFSPKQAEIIITGVDATTGAITAVIIGYPGSGYTSAPTLTVTSVLGTGAVLTANITGDKVTSITITTPGTGYSIQRPPQVKATAGGGDTTFKAVSGTVGGKILPITTSKIVRAGTTATNLLALYV